MLNNATRTSIEKRTGVYKMICDDCDMHYIGQTGRVFFERYKEHLPTSISNINKSNYAKPVSYTHLSTLTVAYLHKTSKLVTHVRKLRNIVLKLLGDPQKTI